MPLRPAAVLAATCLATARALEVASEPVADEVSERTSLRVAPRGIGDLNAISPAGLRGSSHAPPISLDRGDVAYGGEASSSADAAAAFADAHRPAAETRFMPRARARAYVGNILGTKGQDEDGRFSASELQDLRSKAESGDQVVFQKKVDMPSSRWRT